MPHCNKKMLSFFLTPRCNLCCRYCYNAAERAKIKEQTIPMHIAKAAIDWYFSTQDSRHIRFYGPGEPTQEFAKMQQITEYATSHPLGRGSVTMEIQTNGVFARDIRQWLLDHANIIWMSFDGMAEVQNQNRPINKQFWHLYNDCTSAEVLEENIRWLTENKGQRNLMVGVRVTITNQNMERQKEMVDYFYALGVRYAWTNPLFYAVGEKPVCQDKQKQQSYSFHMEQYLSQYLEAYQYAKEKGMFWGSFLTINFDGESPYHCRSCTPLQAPHITPDGYISACDMVVLGEKPYHMDTFICGKWDEDKHQFVFDDEKIRRLNHRKSTNMRHCRECLARLHCGGYCLGEIVNETGRLDGQNPLKCSAVRKLYKSLGTCETYPYMHP